VDVWRITLAALRRWYILVPLLGLTAYVTMSVGNSVRPEYQATTTFMYVEGTQETDRPNPYGSLVGASQVVSIILNSVQTKRVLAEDGFTAAYEIEGEKRTAITVITTRGDSAENAEGTGEGLIEAARADLATRQGEAGIPKAAQITLQVLEPPTVVAAVQDGKTRIQAVIGVVGAAIALLVAVLFDDIIGLVKRARHRRRRTDDHDIDDDDVSFEAAMPSEATTDANNVRHATVGASSSDEPADRPSVAGRADAEARLERVSDELPDRPSDAGSADAEAALERVSDEPANRPSDAGSTDAEATLESVSDEPAEEWATYPSHPRPDNTLASSGAARHQ
jgi:hypothetical protein